MQRPGSRLGVLLDMPRTKPPLSARGIDAMVRTVATLGGFLNRKCDGLPGPKTRWIGLQRAPDFVLALEAQRSIEKRCG